MKCSFPINRQDLCDIVAKVVKADKRRNLFKDGRPGYCWFRGIVRKELRKGKVRKEMRKRKKEQRNTRNEKIKKTKMILMVIGNVWCVIPVSFNKNKMT